jgi:hypothetical protein
MYPDGSTRLRDDNRNKAVLFANRIMFGYTGLAQFGPRRQRTDEWLAEALSANGQVGDQSAILDAVTEAATERLNSPRLRRLPSAVRAHEFVACGWACLPLQNRGFTPYLAVITNMRGPEGGLRSVPADRFEQRWESLQPDQDFSVVTSGQQLSAPDGHALVRDVAGAGPDLRELGAVLIHHIRKAAATNRTVGRGVLLNSLPRKAIRPGDEGFVLAAGPLDETATFFSVPADGNDPCQYGPIAVAASGMVLSNFTAGPADVLGMPTS